MTVANGPSRLGLVVLTTAGAAFTVLVAGGFGVAEFRLVYVAIAAVAVLPLLVLAAINGHGLPSSRMAPAIWACLAAFAISTLTSRVPRMSLEMLAYVVLLAGLYVGAVSLLRSPVMRAHVAGLAVVLCAIVALLYVAEVVGAWLVWWDLVGRVTLPPLRPAYAGLNLASPNPVAALVLLLLGFAVGAADVRRRSGVLLASALIAVAALAVVLTASRGAWLGAAAAISVTSVAAMIAIPDARHWAVARIRSRVGVIGAAGLAALAFGAAWLAAVSGRLTVTDTGREAFTTTSLRMFESSPMTGTGPATWPILRASFTRAGEPDSYVPHAHSIYTQALAELGLLGVVAGAVVAVALGTLLVQALKSADRSRQRVALATLFAVVVLAVHQAVDMFMNIPAILFAAALPIVWLDATAAVRSTPQGVASAGWSSMRARGFPLAAAIAIAFITVALFRIESIAIGHQSAVAAAEAGDWHETVRLAREAVDADPDVPAYQFTLGIAAANAGDLATAESALSRSAAADDYTYAWLDLAAVRWQSGDADGARDALERAERLGIQRPTVALPAGWLRQQLGDQSIAIHDYGAALLGAPTVAADPFWVSTSEGQAAWPEIWTTALTKADDRTRLVLALAAGRLELAASLAADFANGESGEVYASLVASWTGDATSWALLQAHVSQHPTDVDGLHWCQLVAEHLDDQVAFARCSGLLAIVLAPALAQPQLAHIASGLARQSRPSVFDGYELLYRRSVPARLIVATLPQLSFGDP